MSEFPQLKQIVEGAILAADRPLSIDQMIQLFEREQPSRAQVREVLEQIQAECEGRGYELKEVASGYRFQVRTEYSEWVGRLWEERPPRYSRALLETLALIAYKQPITRGDIEEIRGVTVSTNIIRSLMEREWIRIVGHRDVPGRPAIYATTKTFLDYFNLSSLDELPTLSEIKDLDKLNPELELEEEMPEARSLELDDGQGEGTEAHRDEDTDDDFDLDEVTDQVNQIQDNIRNLFAEEEEEDDFDDEDDDIADGEMKDEGGAAPAEQTAEDPESANEDDTPSAESSAGTETGAEEQVGPEADEATDRSADREGGQDDDEQDVADDRAGSTDEETTDNGDDAVDEDADDVKRSW